MIADWDQEPVLSLVDTKTTDFSKGEKGAVVKVDMIGGAVIRALVDGVPIPGEAFGMVAGMSDGDLMPVMFNELGTGVAHEDAPDPVLARRLVIRTWTTLSDK